MVKIKLPEWNEFSDKVIKEQHGEVSFYRDLYFGNHGKLFPRAEELIKNGELVDNLYSGMTKNPHGNVRTPYLIANACKIVCKVPAAMVSRAVGKFKLNEDQEFPDPDYVPPAQETDEQGNPIETEDEEDGILYLSDILEDIERASGFNRGAHFSNILQHQIDGGLVGVPIVDDNGVRIDFKKREVYFPHEDNLGCDVGFTRTLEDMNGEMKDFFHVHRQRVEDNRLKTKEILYRMNDTVLDEVDEDEAVQILEVDKLENTYEDRNRPFIVYWANEATFDFPLGMSALYGQEGKQDEINWTLTQAGITFQRNGKPRLAVSPKVMNALRQAAFERYNDETMIDHRDLEVLEMDENGRALEVIQIDVTKIGDIKWVKDLMKMMFIETETSEKAVDFYLQEGGSAAQSGVAKFYDLLTSIIKAERLIGEYVDFLQELVENCFWLMSKQPEYSTIEIVRPSVQIMDMIPTAQKERIETEALAKEKGLRSTERAVSNINPNDSDTALEQELTAIEGDNETINSASASPLALNSVQSMLDNRVGNTNTAAGNQNATAGTQNASGAVEE
jgi:hypothetical protein